MWFATFPAGIWLQRSILLALWMPISLMAQGFIYQMYRYSVTLEKQSFPHCKVCLWQCKAFNAFAGTKWGIRQDAPEPLHRAALIEYCQATRLVWSGHDTKKIVSKYQCSWNSAAHGASSTKPCWIMDHAFNNIWIHQLVHGFFILCWSKSRLYIALKEVSNDSVTTQCRHNRPRPEYSSSSQTRPLPFLRGFHNFACETKPHSKNDMQLSFFKKAWNACRP